nr:hypothetical protein [Tanacetum cinerariifolium]
QDYASQHSSLPFRHQDYVSQTQMGGSSSQPQNIGSWQAPNTYEAAGEQVVTSPTKNRKKTTRNRQKRMIENDDAPRQTPWTTKEEFALAKGEQVVTSPTKNRKKATRNRQKRMIENDDAPRQTLWTTKEEFALAKGWLAVYKNSKDGNAKKKQGFWCEVLEYIESKTKQYGRRTYGGVLGKWKTMRPPVIRFSRIYSNVMRMAQESGAEDEDNVQKAMIRYEVETEIPFKLQHCWEDLKDRPK